MPSIGEAFQPPEELIDWAESAAIELRASLTHFFETNPNKIVQNFDARSGEHVLHLLFKGKIPKEARRQATEALTHARHSFDQSLFAARTIVEGRPPDKNFPWASSPADLEGRLRRWKVDDRIAHVIRQHEPYETSDSHPGGNDLIRALAKIANNKHTVGLGVTGRLSGARIPSGLMMRSESFKMNIGGWVDTKRGETELVRWKGHPDLAHQYQIGLQVCLRDPKFTEAVDITVALPTFIKKAKAVCHDLRRVASNAA